MFYCLFSDPEILNGLRWSAALDRVFTKNFEEDPTLRWQYFGSARGFMRIYPALRYVHLSCIELLLDYFSRL